MERYLQETVHLGWWYVSKPRLLSQLNSLGGGLAESGGVNDERMSLSFHQAGVSALSDL